MNLLLTVTIYIDNQKKKKIFYINIQNSTKNNHLFGHKVLWKLDRNCLEITEKFN